MTRVRINVDPVRAVVGHRLIRICGSFSIPLSSTNPPTFLTISTSQLTTTYPISKNHSFKAFVRLSLGVNQIEIDCRGSEAPVSLSVVFAPIPKPGHFVRFYYVLPSKQGAEEDLFQSGDGVSGGVEAALARIRLAALLMQCFCSDSLDMEGHGPLTFQLGDGDVDDGEGNPVVHVVRSWLTRKEIHALGGGWANQNEGYAHMHEVVRRHMDGAGRDRNCIPVAIMSMTEFNPQQKSVRAHTALGGPGLALFGSGTLHTWPTRVSEIASACVDTAPVPAHLFDDCAHRGRARWANFSTGLGATIHELGHGFGLVHTVDGIMARGFDDMNLYMSAVDPTGAPVPRGAAERGARWSPSSALLLSKSPHFSHSSSNPISSCSSSFVDTATWVRTDGAGFFMSEGNGTLWRECQGPADGVSAHTPVFTFERVTVLGDGSLHIVDRPRSIHIKLGHGSAHLSTDGTSWNLFAYGNFAARTPVPVCLPDLVVLPGNHSVRVASSVLLVEVMDADGTTVAHLTDKDLQGLGFTVPLHAIKERMGSRSSAKRPITARTVRQDPTSEPQGLTFTTTALPM